MRSSKILYCHKASHSASDNQIPAIHEDARIGLDRPEVNLHQESTDSSAYQILITQKALDTSSMCAAIPDQAAIAIEIRRLSSWNTSVNVPSKLSSNCPFPLATNRALKRSIRPSRLSFTSKNPVLQMILFPRRPFRV